MYIYVYICILIKVYVVEKKLFSLDYIDSSFKTLNLRSFDGDRPSSLKGISLATTDSNLHQHGKYTCVHVAA